MRGRVEPLFVAFADADGCSVAHIQRNADFESLRGVDGAFAEYWTFVDDIYIIVWGYD